MLDVSTALGRAYGIHKRAMLEAVTIRPGHQQLPPLADVRMHIPFAGVEKATIFNEVLHWEFLPVEVHRTALIAGTGYVVHSLPHERGCVRLQLAHPELGEVGPKLYARVVLSSVLLDLRLAFPAHVAVPLLSVELPLSRSLHDEARAENVGQLCTEAIPAAGHLLFRVVVIVTGQQVAEDKLGYVDLVRLVDLDRQPLAVVPDLDALLLHVDLHLDRVHALVALQVVCSVHKDLIKDLVQSRNVADVSGLHLLLFLVPNPQPIILLFHGADVCVRSQKDVLHLGLLLVYLLNGLAPLQLRAIVAIPFQWQPNLL
mmetsp:Transcript_96624/g.268611  ORF Transcript_96624/g.268611 Transcript_96624/m.268611 type:complete len:315 (-) Transcript_96624:137-1081(-)